MRPTHVRLCVAALWCAGLVAASRPSGAQAAWGNARITEDVRIGVLDGDTNYTFGVGIQGLTVGRDGSIYVVDRGMSAGPATHLRQFTPAGRFVRMIGRYGQGPGEFNDPAGLTTASSGNLLMFDGGSNRVLVYDSIGKSLTTWILPTQVRSGNSRFIVPDNGGGAYVPSALSTQGGPGPLLPVVFHFTPAGALDTIAQPDCGHAGAPIGPFQPVCQRFFHPAGGFLMGWSETYAFDLQVPGKPAVHFQRSIPIERLQPEEQAEQAARLGSPRPSIMGMRSSVGPDGRVVAETTFGPVPRLNTAKPAYKTFLVDLDQRVWVQVSVAAEKLNPPPAPARAGAPAPLLWVEPVVYDVFQPDGRYMGRVRMPAKAQFRTARGDAAYGVVRGDDDEAYIVRWRITPGG